MFDIKKCEMCRKKAIQLHDHHLIPWRFSHDDSDSNIMRLCPSCHRKADVRFLNFIVYGDISIIESSGKRAGRRYVRKYIKRKVLYSVVLLKRVHYHDTLKYNIKTGNICITQWWHYFPNKHISMGATSRNRLINAAGLKGQTRLVCDNIKG